MDTALGEVWEAFLSALDHVGLRGSFEESPPASSRWNAVGSIEGVPVVVEMKAAPTVGDVLQLARTRELRSAYGVLVARRVSAAVRASLAEHDIGFFDARGHLRLWRSPLRVDTDVPAFATTVPRAGRPRLDNASTLDVALAVLDGLAAHGVRATAGLIGRSPGTVSKQLATLRSAYLVDELGAPTVPDLFEAVVEEWHPTRIALADLPRPGRGAVNDRLQLGLDDIDGPGWVLADSSAAAAWGAPVVLSGDAPPDFYVPDHQVLRQARTLLGDAEFGHHACTVAVAPAPSVCLRRYDRSTRFNDPFPAPSPIVAAIELARDPARGRETLDAWSRDLPPELRRVW